jgi:hypothetical protein
MLGDLRLITSVCFGLALTACSGSDTPDAGPVDAGPVDTGIMPDAGPPDTGVQGPCNPVDGTGCNMADNFCVLQTDTDKGQCRELINAAVHEAECNQSLQNCAAGMACLFLEGDDTPVCRKVCTIIGGAGCEGLTGASATYACNVRLQGTRRHGFCGEVAPSCDPLNDMCPMSENCDFVDDQGNTGCVAAGPVQLGGSCVRDRCRRGALCVTLETVSMDPTCYQPCDTQNPTCTQANYQCGDIGADFGLCVPN